MIITGSFVIGDRITDVQLAKNLGCKAIWLKQDAQLGGKEIKDTVSDLEKVVALETIHWSEIYSFLKSGLRNVIHERNTRETKIRIELNADGNGKADIHTGLAFFDHMLDQIARHGKMDLKIEVQGDLHIDEHHTIEDTGIALGEAMAKALADKRGMERYGFALPMDDADARYYWILEEETGSCGMRFFNGRKWATCPQKCFFIFLNLSQTQHDVI